MTRKKEYQRKHTEVIHIYDEDAKLKSGDKQLRPEYPHYRYL